MNTKNILKEKLVLFLGNVRVGEYEWFCENNIEIGIVLDKNVAKKTGHLPLFKFVKYFNFKRSTSELFKIIDTIKKTYEIICLLHTREFYVKYSAILVEKYGFSGLPLEAARNSLNKRKMRSLFAKNIGQTAAVQYAPVENIEGIKKFIDRVGLPVIIKPTNLYASIFVNLIRNQNEIVTCYEQMVKKINNYYKKTPTKASKISLQIEEFLQGSVHSMDCLSDINGNIYVTPIVDVITARDIGIDDFHHYAQMTPSRLSSLEQASAKQMVIAGVKALGIKGSLAHAEFVFTKAGPKLLEIAARAGGNRANALKCAYGLNLIPAYAKMLQGLDYKEELQLKFNRAFAYVTPYPIHEGLFNGFNQLERIYNLPTYYKNRTTAQIGEQVGFAKDGYMYFLTIELSADNLDAILRDIKQIQNMGNLIKLSNIV